MATNRNVLRCDVCKTLTCVRTLIGYLDQHPLRICCGNCGIEIRGTVHIDHKNSGYRFEFQNAVDVGGECPDEAAYYMEASGELLTLKLQATPDGKVPQFFSPFFRAQQQMGIEGVEEFKEKILPFIELSKERWPTVKRVNDLWARGNFEFLKGELQKILPQDKYPLNNRLEMLKGVRHATMSTIYPLLDWRRFDARVQHIQRSIVRASDQNKQNLTELAREFAQRGLLEKYRAMLLGRIDAFIAAFPFLIPVFSKPFFKKGFSSEIYRQYGLSTCGFEDLKGYYADAYEDVLVMSRLAAAHNNLLVRGDYRTMAKKRKDVSSLEDFDNLSKGSRLEFFNGRETFDPLLYGSLNVGIRNAIAHNSFNYDGRTQEITYYPDGNRAATKKEQMFLLHFSELCLESFYALVNLSELALWTERIYLMSEGEAPDLAASWTLVLEGGE
ncbi:MAG: hypothetical protein WC712_13385 [Candidatus Brocadiia bacterium]